MCTLSAKINLDYCLLLCYSFSTMSIKSYRCFYCKSSVDRLNCYTFLGKVGQFKPIHVSCFKNFAGNFWLNVDYDHGQSFKCQICQNQPSETNHCIPTERYAGNVISIQKSSNRTIGGVINFCTLCFNNIAGPNFFDVF